MSEKISSPQEMADIFRGLHAQLKSFEDVKQEMSRRLGIRVSYQRTRRTVLGMSLPTDLYLEYLEKLAQLSAQQMHPPLPSSDVPAREEGISPMLKKTLLEIIEQVIELATYNDPIPLKKALTQVSKLVETARAKRQEADAK